MRPFFRFYGSKWSSVPLYPRPGHGLVVEPFAGSASYSVRHEPRRVILCDRDPYIVGVWRYLIGASAAEILALPLLGPDQSVDDLGPVPQEARWLVGFWVNTATSSPRATFGAGTKKLWDAKPGIRWGKRTRSRLAHQVDRIRHWEIREGDCMDVLADVGAATYFVDPPYQQMGKHYRFGSKLLDFPALGRWCRERQGQVIACEHEGADWLPFSPLARTHSAKTCKSSSAEAVWCSDGWRPMTQPGLFDAEATP